MKAKLKVIKNWEFEEFELTGTSFKYSPTGCKGMVARSEDEIVFWTYHLVQKCSGVLWVKGEVSRWIPSPEPKEQQDVWEDPVLLSCDRGILLVCPASKSLWWMPQMDGEWIPIPMDNWCAQGIPKPVAVTGSQGVFPIVCRVDNSADATNSFTSLTVDFETMTAHWAESGSCVYSKAGTRQTHLAAVERAGGNFAQADFHYNYPKVNGSPPGEELCKRSYSVPDAAEILKVKPETIYTLIRQGKLKTETADFCMRIPKEDFERWYRSQSRYRTAADRERDREIEAQTISIPEMAKLLGIPRKNVYGILDCKKYRDCFVIERVADRPRITKKSFKAWLKSQSTYQLQKPKKETHEEPPLKLQCPKNGKYYSFQEIQAFYGISRPTLDSWVLKEGIPTMKLGRVKRIQKDAFDEVLKSKRKVEEDV